MPDELSFEDAATLNAGTLTAVQALFHPDRFGFVEPPQTVDSETWVSDIILMYCFGLT